MVSHFLRGNRFDLRSSMPGFLLVLVVLSLLMILAQYTTTLEILSSLSRRQYAPRSTDFPNCRQFPKKEKIKWEFLYYFQDHSKEKSLIWCKVCKAGSTTVARIFLRRAGAKNFEHSGGGRRLREFYPELSPQVMTERLNTTFKLLVVRHPFERLLSAYRDKFGRYRELVYRKMGPTMVKRPVKNGTVVKPTFPEFITYLLETNPEMYDRHWMSVSRLCAPCSIHYDAIVKMENFNQEIKVALEQAGIHEDVGWGNSNGTNRTTIERYFRQLSFTQLEQLYDIYREDFLLFGYSPHKYFSIVANATAKG